MKKPDREGLIAVAPKMTALHVTEKARARIFAAGGEILTFNQQALRAPTGLKTMLIKIAVVPVRPSVRPQAHHSRTPSVMGATRDMIRHGSAVTLTCNL
ncbi:60S ribosomal protein L18-like [Hyposmocoma kahamanoa]|uniref:60S ribosomal protein L18-like n=1 Tax=Hyposmocoma kahamanoa TaxID=1477025 RepID=UPI000E6D9AD4|nr:60S ribosomal protein L18-like [Hyposmocoma kahamanoa]